MRRRSALALLGVLLLSCSREPEELAPYGQALISVDTNLGVPHVVSRLRIDLYADDGRWFESSDIARPDPRDWPVTFSVFSEDTSDPTRVWVRLRVYPEARVRDYRGERFWNWTDELGVDGEPTEGPRLVQGEIDRTPATEPAPLVTVDRLLLVRLEPGRTGTVLVVLDGACAGTMAKLAIVSGNGPLEGQAESCIASEKERALVVEQAPEDVAGPAASVQGSFGHQPCSSNDEERICVPGGAAIFGSAELTLVPEPELEPLPERLVRSSAFLIDRHEVTVARFRAAVASGFSPSFFPTVNDGPLSGDPQGSCSYTSAPGEREAFALTCIDWRSARELCQFLGGDLPTEAQWEYAASSAGQRGKSRFPWGDEEPTCERAVFGRLTLAGSPGYCEDAGVGPLAVDAAPFDATPEGVIGLAGGVTEWTLDRAAPLTDDCWRQTSLTDPICAAETASERSTRGGSWPAPPSVLRNAVRYGVAPSGRGSFIGVRCVYPVGATR